MNLLITGAWSVTDDQVKAIEKLGHRVIFMQNEKDDLPCDPSDVEGIVCNGLFLYHDIEKFTSLKFIQLTSAGFDRIPLDAVKKHNIEIHNARGVYSIPMAEYAVCGVLQLYKQTEFFNSNQKNKKWQKHRNIQELYGKTVVVVGAGNVGTECAKRFTVFGCRVIGIDLYAREDNDFEVVLPFKCLADALSQADIVVLTLPLTDDTKGIIGKSAFDSLKKGALLVNIARGAVIDTSAMIYALEKRKLGGAVLDVFEEEPLSENSPLWDMDNVIITPHNSFVGAGNGKRLFDVIYRNLFDLG